MVTKVEKAVAAWITDQLQVTVNLYLGTDTAKGEVIVRGIGLYEKNTFRTLLGYHVYRLLRERDEELQRWGRVHLSDKEISSILAQVNVSVNEWVKTWIVFTKRNPDIRISNITGKRSKVLLWINMSEKVWKDSKALINEYFVQLQAKYRGYVICPFFYGDEKERLEKTWPNLKFVSKEDIIAETDKYLEDKLSYDVNHNMISYYVAHVVDNLADTADTTIEDLSIKSKHKDIIKQKKQDFIDYITQQVFSPKGYFYGSLRENVASAVAQGTQPGLTDFTNLMLARALTESYNNLYLSDDKGNLYDKSDLEEVIAINQKFVREIVVPAYTRVLLDNNIVTDDKVTGKAFGYDIPTPEQISETNSELTNKVSDILGDIDRSPYNSFAPDDLADWYKTLKDSAVESAEDKGIDISFVEPVVESNINVMGIATTRVISPVSSTKITSTYSDTSSAIRDSSRITGWKRYYPSGTTDTERITGFKRYYPGVTDDSQLNEGRTTDWRRYYSGVDDDSQNNVGRVMGASRYYPGVDDDSQLNAGRTDDWERYYAYTPTEEARIPDWKRYYPSNVSSESRVANWQRYYPGEGQVATDFLPTYRTFSGHDMVVTVQVPVSGSASITKVIGAFQTISYSVHNEKSPIRVLGDMNVRRYVFGPRMIAGSLVLTVFDRHWMRELFNTYVRIKNETERYFLMDELPAMNITISCVNEYGYNAKLALYGVTIVNEGQIMSINDVYTENTYEFFALNVDYLDRVESTVGKQHNNRLNSIPVDNLEPNKNSEESQSKPANTVTEQVESLEEVDPEDSPPFITKAALALSENSELTQKYQDIFDDCDEGKMSKDSAIKKIDKLEKQERETRYKDWLKDTYNPKYEAMLKKYNVSKSDTKNDTKLKRKLGSKYERFMQSYNAFINASDHMKQLIWANVAAKAEDFRARVNTLDTIVQSEDSTKDDESAAEILVNSVNVHYEEGYDEWPIAVGGHFKESGVTL